MSMVEVDIRMYNCLSVGARLEFKRKQDATEFIKHFYALVHNGKDLYLEVAEKDDKPKNNS